MTWKVSEVMSNHFSLWLGKKLTELGTDDSVFGPYIVSILEVDLLYVLKYGMG